jgi:hypothetical protein
MAAKGSINVAAAGLLLLAAAFLWYAVHAAQAADAALAAASQNQAALKASLQKAQARAAAREHEAATLQAELNARRAQRAAAARPPSERSNPRQAGPSLGTLLASDPKLMDLFLRSYRANLSGRFGAAYLKLGLTPAQIQKFEDLATAHEADQMDLQAAAEAQGLTEADPGITAMRQASNKQFRAAVVAADIPIPPGVISPTRIGTPPTQQFVDQLATTVALSSTPMTFAQVGQLTPILESAGISPLTGPQATSPTIDWQKIALQATGILSGPQLQALQVQTSLYQLGGLVKQFYSQQQPDPAK